MPFDNPYFPQTFDIGTPGAGHIHFANDGSMTLFATDGVTPIVQVSNTVGGIKITSHPGLDEHLYLSTGDPAELAGAALQAENSSLDYTSPNRRPLLEITSPETGQPLSEIILGTGAYDGSFGSWIRSISELYTWQDPVSQVDYVQFDANAGHALLHYDGATLTSPGITNFGDGASAIGGTLNLQNPAAAAASRHTVTFRVATGQTGNLIRMVDSLGSNVVFAVVASGRVGVQNNDTLVLSSASTYGLQIAPIGSAALELASDANGGYIQSFGGKPLFLNKVGNAIQWGSATVPGILGSAGQVSPGGMSGAQVALWSGTGAPNTATGAIGDIYFRDDTPTVALQRIYVKTAAAVWTGVV